MLRGSLPSISAPHCISLVKFVPAEYEFALVFPRELTRKFLRIYFKA